jgi:general secretion pathway protein I
LTRGFTLLEVLMAIAIMGLGLSVLLGAQTGLFASASRTEHISLATGLARCRMSEVELELLVTGYPLVDSEGEGPCCMDQASEGYTCAWKVQRVILPELPLEGEDGGVDGGGGLDLGGALDPTSAGPLGLLSQLGATDGQGLGEKPDMATLATQLTGSMGGVDGIASMAMGLVYPTLKPMLEASIRKVLVSVRWNEGSRARTLDVTQYLTNPQQGQLDPDGGVAGLLQSAAAGGDPNAGTGTSPTPTATATATSTSRGMFGGMFGGRRPGAVTP